MRSPIVAMMLTMALVVLLVACANVAGLLTSRAPHARARSPCAWPSAPAACASSASCSPRRSSSRLPAALAGIGLAYGVIRLFQQRTIISDIGVRVDFHADRRVIAVAVAVSAASALVAGLIPAFRSARVGDLSGTLRNGARDVARAGGSGAATRSSPGRWRWRSRSSRSACSSTRRSAPSCARGRASGPITSCSSISTRRWRATTGHAPRSSMNSSKTACVRCPVSRRSRSRRSCRSIRTIAITSHWCPRATSFRRASTTCG